ncbi:uncharacterized protein [Palaemon carinicauda]|uniref:uncharacterized protein n=1 Tax=Palaemon carinicauda TaxID=392227 RepID=UPI0035B632DE
MRLYGISERLLQEMKSFYMVCKTCVRAENEVSEWYSMKVGQTQGCVISPWLFNLFVDGVVKEVKACVLGRGLKLIHESDHKWELNQLLFADDRVLVTDTEEKLSRLVIDFRTVWEKEVGSLCGKSKVMVCTSGEVGDKLSFMWNGGLLEEVDLFKHLGSVVAVIGGVKADARQRVNEGYSVF